jgi:DNA polymerase III epsilon subunit-like protein
MENGIYGEINELEGKNLLFIDLETTGFPGKATINDDKEKYDFKDNAKYNSSRIVQFGWCYYEKFNLDFEPKLEDVKSIIRKPVDFNKIKTHLIHGITYKKAIKDGLLIGKILNGEFGKCVKSCDYILAYNSMFDFSILANEVHRSQFNKMYTKLINIIDNDKVICMLKLSALLCKPVNTGKYSRKQRDVYHRCYNEYPENQHDAKGDVYAMIKIFKYMIVNKLQPVVQIKIDVKNDDKYITISKEEYEKLVKYVTITRDEYAELLKYKSICTENNKQKNTPSNNGTYWTKQEDEQLCKEYNINLLGSVDISDIHKRSEGSIENRLVKLGIIPNRNSTRKVSEIIKVKSKTVKVSKNKRILKN